jgi:D-proline reductase (dithiol) PrdB
VGLIHRAIEKAGIPGVSIINLRFAADRIKYPRSVLAKFLRGANVGASNNPEQQRDVLLDALRALTAVETPGTVVELPYK